MTLRLTPETLAASYEYFRTTTPFRGWRLPESDAIRFVVTREVGTRGYYNHEQRNLDDHAIGISERCVGSTVALNETMAHEMIHLYQRLARLVTANTQHNADFLRRANIVCRHHIFDPKTFV